MNAACVLYVSVNPREGSLPGRHCVTYVWGCHATSHETLSLADSPHELVHTVRLSIPLQHSAIVVDSPVLVYHGRDAKVVLHRVAEGTRVASRVVEIHTRTDRPRQRGAARTTCSSG